jgi:hypothetical protein
MKASPALVRLPNRPAFRMALPPTLPLSFRIWNSKVLPV